MEIKEFTLEYQKNPIGITDFAPRFSWKMHSDEKNTIQNAYMLKVFWQEKRCWDTGMIDSSRSILVPYEGEGLRDEQEYHAELTVWDNYGNRSMTELIFETGVYDPNHFEAEMISHDFPDEEAACPIFSRSFSVNKELWKARIYVTAQGLYEAELNGGKIGQDYLTPGWTSYRNRLMYQVYDITKQLTSENEISITVGRGWFSGILGYDLKNHRYGDKNAVFAEIHLFYQDGSREMIKTDKSWSVRTGEIQSSELYMGEVVDTFQPKIRTGNVVRLEFDKGILRMQENEPVRITERIEAKEIFHDTAGNLVIDFGQNISGVTEVCYQGMPGDTITIRHAEALDKNGAFYTENLRAAKATDTYICDGTIQTFRPHFTFHGFRYIAVTGIETPKPEMFTACVMHSDMKRTGGFRCSDEKVNQLYSNIIWGQRDNFVDVPTDCPQRDERLGWTGDAQVFSWTAAFQYQTTRFFGKWMRDLAVESSLEAGVPHVVPNISDSYSAAGWGDAAVIIPWVIYQTYGDERILKESWACMHEWVDFITAHCDENGLWKTGYQFGDWLALDREAGPGCVGATDKYYVANAFYIYVTDLVRKTAQVLGDSTAAERYAILYDKTLESFRKEYFTERGRIISETQTGCVLALHFKLAREHDRPGILTTLIRNIEEHKNHLTTGFLGTPYLCHVLTEEGYHDLASVLFLKEDYPSWLYSVNMGATTIWERWNSINEDGSFDDSGMNSLNHYAYGSIADWIYRRIGGINQLEPGYHKFVIRPNFVKGLEEAAVSFDSPYGLIRSEWSCKNKQIHVVIEIPANTTAEVYLPEKEEMLKLGSGVYEYTYDTETNLKADRFTIENTLAEILVVPGVEQKIYVMAPQLEGDPTFQVARRLNLATIMNVAPETRPMFEQLLQHLNQ